MVSVVNEDVCSILAGVHRLLLKRFVLSCKIHRMFFFYTDQEKKSVMLWVITYYTNTIYFHSKRLSSEAAGWARGTYVTGSEASSQTIEHEYEEANPLKFRRVPYLEESGSDEEDVIHRPSQEEAWGRRPNRNRDEVYRSLK